MDTIPKIGIVVGIVAVCVFMPLWVIVTIAENEYLFSKVFFDKNLHEEKMRQAETFKAILERYPDALVSVRAHGMHGSIEAMAYSDQSVNELRVMVHYDHVDDRVFESADCRVMDPAERGGLGTTPAELIEDPPIPKAMFLRGDANDRFAPDFVRYTNCLDEKPPQPEEDLKADYFVAIPVGTSVPGCQEDLSCFEPYSSKIKVGDVVAFRNFDSESHTVTSGSIELGPSGIFDSKLIEPGGQFAHKFTVADEYDYFCMLHPWQTGKIIVHEN